jgi:hypothetical protein
MAEVADSNVPVWEPQMASLAATEAAEREEEAASMAALYWADASSKTL